MKAIISYEKFLRALRSVASIAGTDDPKLRMNVVSIEATERGYVLLSSTNWEQTIRVKLRATVVSSGTVYLNARQLLRMVKMMWGDDLRIWQDTRYQVKISDGRVTYAADDLPTENVVLTHLGERKFENCLPVPRLLELSSKVLYAASADAARPTLMNVSFNGRVAASDGFQISMVNETVDGLQGLIPAKFLSVAKRAFHTDEITAEIGGEWISLSDGTTTLEGRYYSSDSMKFPDIDAIIPKEAKMVADLPTDDLQMALYSALAIHQVKDDIYGRKIVRLLFDRESVMVSAENEKLTMSMKLPAIIQCNDPEFKFLFEIAFNAQYLLQHIRRSYGRVQMQFTENNRPVLIKSAEGGSWQGVLMPAHLG